MNVAAIRKLLLLLLSWVVVVLVMLEGSSVRMNGFDDQA
jgi:hypothetical protein